MCLVWPAHFRRTLLREWKYSRRQAKDASFASADCSQNDPPATRSVWLARVHHLRTDCELLISGASLHASYFPRYHADGARATILHRVFFLCTLTCSSKEFCAIRLIPAFFFFFCACVQTHAHLESISFLLALLLFFHDLYLRMHSKSVAGSQRPSCLLLSVSMGRLLAT